LVGYLLVCVSPGDVVFQGQGKKANASTRQKGAVGRLVDVTRRCFSTSSDFVALKLQQGKIVEGEWVPAGYPRVYDNFPTPGDIDNLSPADLERKSPVAEHCSTTGEHQQPCKDVLLGCMVQGLQYGTLLQITKNPGGGGLECIVALDIDNRAYYQDPRISPDTLFQQFIIKDGKAVTKKAHPLIWKC
jgi:hypothetical protein